MVQKLLQKQSRVAQLPSKQLGMYRAFLEKSGIIHEKYRPPIFPGCIAVDAAILEKAAHTAMAFHHACHACFARMQTDADLRKKMLRIVAGYSALEQSVLCEGFFMGFFRIDFYSEQETGELKIIEANTSPGAFPEHATMDTFLSKMLPCGVPDGFCKAQPSMVIDAFRRYWHMSRGAELRSLGLVASDDGSLAPLAEAQLFAKELRAHGIAPVLCAIRGGRTLTLLDDPGADLPVIDALYHNPGGTLPVREEFTTWLSARGISLLPPRSNLLFTNKSFLATLREHLDTLTGISRKDRELLRNALLPSFDLHNWKEHTDEMQLWSGVVLKRDFGSSGNQVEILPFHRHPWPVIRERLSEMQRNAAQAGETWTIQRLVHPTTVSMGEKQVGFDIMTYTIAGAKPAVLFASRPFTDDKANIAHGAWYGQICTLAEESIE